MPDFLESIMAFFNQYYAVILVFFAGIYLLYIFTKNHKTEPKYKPVVLEKEIHKYLLNIFDLTKEYIGYGKTLYIGTRDAGFVLKSVFINQYPDWNETINLNKLQTKYPEVKPIIEQANGKPVKVLNGFEVCKRGRLSRLLAYFGMGIDVFLIDKELVEINEYSININAYSKPVKMFGVWVFSEWGKEELEEIAFKVKHEQHLDAMVNIIPKSIFLGDVNAGKEKATYDMLEEMNSEKRKEQLEQIKKA